MCAVAAAKAALLLTDVRAGDGALSKPRNFFMAASEAISACFSRDRPVIPFGTGAAARLSRFWSVPALPAAPLPCTASLTNVLWWPSTGARVAVFLLAERVDSIGKAEARRGAKILLRTRTFECLSCCRAWRSAGAVQSLVNFSSICARKGPHTGRTHASPHTDNLVESKNFNAITISIETKGFDNCRHECAGSP